MDFSNYGIHFKGMTRTTAMIFFNKKKEVEKFRFLSHHQFQACQFYLPKNKRNFHYKIPQITKKKLKRFWNSITKNPFTSCFDPSTVYTQVHFYLFISHFLNVEEVFRKIVCVCVCNKIRRFEMFRHRIDNTHSLCAKADRVDSVFEVMLLCHE